MATKKRFRVLLEKDAGSEVTGIVIPFDVEKTFGTRARVPVRGTIQPIKMIRLTHIPDSLDDDLQIFYALAQIVREASTRAAARHGYLHIAEDYEESTIL